MVAGLTVVTVRGDLCLRAVDAIVNAANSHLWMGGGVAGAIKRRGGEHIEQEAMAQGPIPVGAAVPTGAGRLPARYVVHAAVMGPDLVTDVATVRTATESALAVARTLGLRTVALPALGTGVGGLSLPQVAQAMLEAIRAHAVAGTTLARVECVVLSAEACRAFCGAIAGEGIPG